MTSIPSESDYLFPLLTALESITILHVTDIHAAHGNLQRLQHFLSKSSTKPDLVICTGDIVNINHGKCSNEDMEKEKGEFIRVMRKVGEFASYVVFVPGNHDPEACYPELMKDGGSTIKELFGKDIPYVSLQNKLVRLLPNLSILGLGGSVDAYARTDPTKSVIWEGYPYNDEKLRTMFSTLLRDVPRHDDVLILTHSGPDDFATTDDNRQPWDPESRIESGSLGLRESMSEFIVSGGVDRRDVISTTESSSKQRVIGWWHGHSHYSRGMGQFAKGDLPVMNSGPLRDGYFGVMVLARQKYDKSLVDGADDNDVRWLLDDIRFCRL